MSALKFVEEPCHRCRRMVTVAYYRTPEGLEFADDQGPIVCGWCDYTFGSPLPGKGYCAECWSAGTLTKTDTATGVCMTCTLEAE